MFNDKNRKNPIEFLHLIEKTNRRSEELIIKNTGNSTLKITDISSNYKALNSSNANVDVLSFYDGNNLTNYTSSNPLEIASGNQKTLTIYFDDIRFPDTNGDGTIDEKDDDDIYITHNREFIKTITITTDSTNGAINTNSSNKYEIFVPFSIYHNLYESNYPSSYEWEIAEVINEFGEVDGNNNPINSSYEKPYGHILDSPLIPSRVHIAQLRVKNKSNSSKKFRFEVVDTSRNWTEKPYISLAKIAPDASKEEIVLEIDANTTSGSSDSSITNTSFNNRLLVLNTRTNNEMNLGSYNITLNKFDEKYDLKKDGECIVIKVTEGTEDSDGCFIPTTENQSFNSGNDVIVKEKSVVTYVIGAWKGRAREFFANSYINEGIDSFSLLQERIFYSNSYCLVNDSFKHWVDQEIQQYEFWGNIYNSVSDSYTVPSHYSEFFVNSYYYEYPDYQKDFFSYSISTTSIDQFFTNSYYNGSESDSLSELYRTVRNANGEVETGETTFYVGSYMQSSLEFSDIIRTVKGADPDPPTPTIYTFYGNSYMGSLDTTSISETISMFFANSYYPDSLESTSYFRTDSSFSSLTQFFTNSYYEESSDVFSEKTQEYLFYANNYTTQDNDSLSNITVDNVSIIEYNFYTNSYMDNPTYPTNFENWSVTTYS